MTNNDDRIARLLAQLEADKAKYSNPTLPAIISRPAPRPRRHSVRHRSIR